MDNQLRYVSVLGLVIHPDHTRFLVGYRSDDEPFWPGLLAMPAGRLEGRESLERRLRLEIEQETGVDFDPSEVRYVGEIEFERDGYPVNQLCFAVYATAEEVGDSLELVSLKWVTQPEFMQEIGTDLYLNQLGRIVERAVRLGLLRKD
jgi:8-oxo-dGTP pyrophosphatase MutT (NUDIX family)